MSFRARDIAEDASAREELVARTGRMAVPVIVVLAYLAGEGHAGAGHDMKGMGGR